MASTVVCLALEVWDVIRWVRGERYVPGSREAAQAGPSEWTFG